MTENILTFLRCQRDKFIKNFQYQSALFLSDKIISLDNSRPIDVIIFCKCLFWLGEYQRTAYIIKTRGLHLKDIECCCLLIRCYLKCKRYSEALKLVNHFKIPIEPHPLLIVNATNDKIRKWSSTYLYLRALVYEAMDNRDEARKTLREVLCIDFCAYEAFYRITHHHMCSKREEVEILNQAIEQNELAPEELNKFIVSFMKFFYYLILKKYDTPSIFKIDSPFEMFKDNLDYKVALADQCFHNCFYEQCLPLTSEILKKDIYNRECLVIKLSCLIDKGYKDEIFAIAQNLTDFYPENEISWFALGAYYHLCNKVEVARRFLLKAISLNETFVPAWLLLGNMHSRISEHDQAMVLFFKASHLLPGHQLPLLYIGVEYVNTNNFELGEKFMDLALAVAPNDPFTLNELACYAYNRQRYPAALNYIRYARELVEKLEVPISVLPHQFESIYQNDNLISFKFGVFAQSPECEIIIDPDELYENASKQLRRATCSGLENAWFSFATLGFLQGCKGNWFEAIDNIVVADHLDHLTNQSAAKDQDKGRETIDLKDTRKDMTTVKMSLLDSVMGAYSQLQQFKFSLPDYELPSIDEKDWGVARLEALEVTMSDELIEEDNYPFSHPLSLEKTLDSSLDLTTHHDSEMASDVSMTLDGSQDSSFRIF